MPTPVLFLKSTVRSYTRKSGVVVAAHERGPAPKTATANEGYGFHGEALHHVVRAKHGPEKSPYDLPEKEYGEANEVASKKFSDTAHSLVSGGHFESHEQARDYLDSVHGRHLHDSATFHDGDATKVPWLKRDIENYKNRAGIA